LPRRISKDQPFETAGVAVDDRHAVRSHGIAAAPDAADEQVLQPREQGDYPVGEDGQELGQ